MSEQHPAQQPPPPPPYGHAPQAHGQMQPLGAGPVGEVRGTGVAILLYFVTFGIYGIYYWFKVHEEMKRHTGQGIGGVVALVLALFVGIVMPYLTSSEVGTMQERAGRKRTVSAVTGLWYLPGIFILVGPFIWFVKTNGALNEYWESVGARR
ncbi:hypothetical protein I601_0416 [Nocardioides dokdonensis FR1436]|uniref:DUF4234 domain-containing protein n=1 Tax=Nocardioides dokdonensis FR1436 TaxID=1300347 RepID=A0A1A9GF21_9ACTN|nr:DUF4234 domain-containing protein [Nocardioides dokdonensis]ANH36868.1 hypothetical protein I601_0416 [Nocardioides dokdonensis FR1436]